MSMVGLDGLRSVDPLFVSSGDGSLVEGLSDLAACDCLKCRASERPPFKVGCGMMEGDRKGARTRQQHNGRRKER